MEQEDDLAFGEDPSNAEEDSQQARDEVEDLPNYDMYESDGGESLSDGGNGELSFSGCATFLF